MKPIVMIEDDSFFNQILVKNKSLRALRSCQSAMSQKQKHFERNDAAFKRSALDFLRVLRENSLFHMLCKNILPCIIISVFRQNIFYKAKML